MKKITVFKNIWEKTEPIFVDPVEIFKRIKDGNSKGIVNKIRASKTDEEYQNLKKRLPSICFSGRFSKREKEALLEHSGLMCLDIDGLRNDDLIPIKEKICKDEFVYSCFVSPGGKGLKVIVKITDEIEYHKGQFIALEKHFNHWLSEFKSTKENKKHDGQKIDPKQGKYLCVNIDKSGKDVSRVCYESYDSDIYYNEDSETWYEVLEEKTVTIDVDINDVDLTIKLLQKWIDKKDDYYKGNRNNFMYKFASSMCRFGVPDYTAQNYLSAKYNDFDGKELQTTVKSAYKSNDFGAQSFSEQEKKSGFSKIDIEGKKSVTAFWTINDRGRVKIDSRQFLKFIEANGFGIYRHSQKDAKWQFVKVKNMIVDVVTVIDIKHEVLDYVKRNAPEPVFDELQNKNRYFENTYLNALPLIEVEQIRDKKDSTYIFFEKFYYEVFQDKSVKHGYIDLEGKHIWRNQICKKEITEVVDFKKHDFTQFVVKALGEDRDKTLGAMTAIGYGIHTYKKKRLAKLVYACDGSDAELDGMAAGGTGKNLLFESLEYVRSVVKIDGKDFDKRDKFKFQTVGDDAQVVSIDDYEGDIKELFTRVTGHFEVERKGLDKTVIDFDKSPKIFVSSNSAPKGFSDSFKRRTHQINFDDHYNANHTPADDFGERDFFSEDWVQKDWNCFYSFMFKCFQLYLKHGLKTDENNDIYKHLVKNCGREFTDWMLNYDISTWKNGKMIFATYLRDSSDEIKITAFYSNLRKFCAINKWKLESQGSGELKELRILK